MVSVNGSVSSGYEGVKDAFAANFNDDFEVGASLAVMHKGEMVVDIWRVTARWNAQLNGKATPLSMCGQPQRQ